MTEEDSLYNRKLILLFEYELFEKFSIISAQSKKLRLKHDMVKKKLTGGK